MTSRIALSGFCFEQSHGDLFHDQKVPHSEFFVCFFFLLSYSSFFFLLITSFFLLFIIYSSSSCFFFPIYYYSCLFKRLTPLPPTLRGHARAALRQSPGQALHAALCRSRRQILDSRLDTSDSRLEIAKSRLESTCALGMHKRPSSIQAPFSFLQAPSQGPF